MTLKRRLRSGLDHAARVSGVLATFERRMRRGLTILMYHRVLPEERCRAYPFRSLVMPEGAFAAQARHLSETCEVLPLRDALEPLASARSRSRPLVAITFDDGYADNHAIAAPILEEHGLRGSFFVTTGFVGSPGLLWFDRAALLLSRAGDAETRTCFGRILDGARGAQLPDPRRDVSPWMEILKCADPRARAAILDALESAAGASQDAEGFRAMSVAQVVDLHRRAHEIGSHSVTHPLLPELDDRALEAEVEGSRIAIEGWTGAPVKGFCYPNGDHDERVSRAVRAAGYAYACATEAGLNVPGGERFRLRRIDVTPDRVADSGGRFDLTAFRAELSAFHEAWR